jgi:hypothetical protein
MLDRMTGSSGQDAADRSADERARMVERQLRQRGIADERVLAAMGAVPREAFVDPGMERLAYADEALPIASGQTISQPWIVARMTELLGVGPGDRVLEVGTGSGYQRRPGRRSAAGDDDRADFPSSRRRRAQRLQALVTRTWSNVERDGSVGAPVAAPWRGILVAPRARPSGGSPGALDPGCGRLRVLRSARANRQGPAGDAPNGNGLGERNDRPVGFVRSSRGSWPRLTDGLLATRARPRSVYSPGHDPRLRRAPSGRRRPLLRRLIASLRELGPERDDRHGLLRCGAAREAR